MSEYGKPIIIGGSRGSNRIRGYRRSTASPGSMCWSWPVAVPWQPAVYVCAGEPSVLVHSPDGGYSSPQLDPVLKK